MIRVWDVAKPRMFTLRGHSQRVRQLAFTAGSAELLSADSAGAVRRWELDRIPPTVFEPPTQVARIAVAHDGMSLVAADIAGELRRFSLVTGADTWIGEEPSITALAIARTSVASAEGDHAIIWWRSPPLRATAGGNVRGLAISPDEKWLAAATTAGPIELLAADGAQRLTLAGHAGGTDAVAF